MTDSSALSMSHNPERRDVFPTVSVYLRSLDSVNARILAKMYEHGPRNISLIARELALPIETVRYRFRKMNETILRSTRSLVRYSKLGLTRVSVFVDVSPAAMQMAEQVLKAVDYWTYVVKCSDRYNGFYATYAIPSERLEQFREFFSEVQKLPWIGAVKLHVTGDPYAVVPSLGYMDFQTASWRLDWNEWVACIGQENREEEDNGVGPGGISPCLDKVDMFMVEKLEEDAEVSFVEIAKNLRLTPQNIRYHYESHLLKHGIITGYYPVLLPYPQEISDLHVFVITFNSDGALRQFAHCCRGKPFIGNYARTIGANTLIVHVYLPKMEFQKYLETLYLLSERGKIAAFHFVRLVLPTFSAYTVRNDNFKDGKWFYDHAKYLARLQTLGREVTPTLQQPIAA